VKRLAVAFLTLALLATPLAAEAQEAGKGPRVALFSIDLIPERIAAFWEGLRQLGYVEGRNIAIESQSAAGKSERSPAWRLDWSGARLTLSSRRVRKRFALPSRRHRPSRSSWCSVETRW
jgi:hypothetical protein